MCRFLAYAGKPLILSDLLYRPSNSLIRQSFGAKERPEPLNGDGFGVGWYVPEIDELPCAQHYVTPAWSNRNLHQLAPKVHARMLFAHVRAASPGMAVTEANVHPFTYDRFMWMHNGLISDFTDIVRPLRARLKDDYYRMIQGTTDSEHAFALFMNALQQPLAVVDAAEMRRALVQTIHELNELTSSKGIRDPSFYNFAVTNGREMVVSRYCSIAGVSPPSLHYSRGEKFACDEEGFCDMFSVAGHQAAGAVVIASEQLTEDANDWPDVPTGHTVTVLADLSIKLEAI